MIWVTHDLLPFDPGEAGGQVEMTRMLCFEFDDGSGGTDWPVNPEWRAPQQADANPASVPPLPFVLVALAAVLVIGGSLLAFRRR
jgi:hypothetical protein